MSKTTLEEADVEGAISTAYGEIEQLNEELTNWYDNLPENFQSGDKGDMLQEATGILGSIDEINVPDCAASLAVTYSALKRKASRATRRDFAVEILNSVSAALRERVEELNLMTFEEPVEEEDAKPETEATDEVEDDSTPKTEDERDSMVSDLEIAADEIENHASELEGVEFPGMFG